MKRLMLVLSLAALAVPAALAANAPNAAANAKTTCTKLRASMGAAPFAQAYPTFGACVSHYAPVEQQAIAASQTTCSAQQADTTFAASHDGKTFDQFYGTGKNGNNAFGNCVSGVSKVNSQAEQEGRLNPAQTCRGLRTTLTPTTFASTYGKNASDKNAFGKCISKTASAQSQNEVSASAACKAEQSGSGFDATYGTNADKSNAFGKCVSTKAKAAAAAQQQATVSAAKACAAERKAGAAAFTTKYGTFGRCVTQKKS